MRGLICRLIGHGWVVGGTWILGQGATYRCWRCRLRVFSFEVDGHTAMPPRRL